MENLICPLHDTFQLPAHCLNMPIGGLTLLYLGSGKPSEKCLCLSEPNLHWHSNLTALQEIQKQLLLCVLLSKFSTPPSTKALIFGALAVSLCTDYRQGSVPLTLRVSKDKMDDTHLLDMIDRLGPLPAHLFSAWPRSHYYFRSNGELFNSVVGAKPQEETILPAESIETAFGQEKPTELDDEEGAIVLNLLRQVFR